MSNTPKPSNPKSVALRRDAHRSAPETFFILADVVGTDIPLSRETFLSPLQTKSGPQSRNAEPGVPHPPALWLPRNSAQWATSTSHFSHFKRHSSRRHRGDSGMRMGQFALTIMANKTHFFPEKVAVSTFSIQF